MQLCILLGLRHPSTHFTFLSLLFSCFGSFPHSTPLFSFSLFLFSVSIHVLLADSVATRAALLVVFSVSWALFFFLSFFFFFSSPFLFSVF